ncbi:MAG TPA: RIP metalloprotease RseP, partial [Planctomycetota bacterium]|nr:RIP metalloprotease RseP [Planctomycetota bacterium]
MKLLRDGREEWVTFSPRPREGEPPRVLLGVRASEGTIVRAIQPGSEAALQPLDDVQEIDGKPVHGISWLSVLEGFPGKDNKLELKVTAPDGAERLVTVDRDAFLLWSFRGEVFWGAHPSVGEVKPDTPAARAGLAAGDVVTRLGERPCYSSTEIAGALEGSDAAFFKVSVLRQESRLTLEKVERAALEGTGGITWRTMPRIVHVTQRSPAERLGILPGSSILRIAGKPVHSWPDLLRAIGEASATTEVEVAWLTPEGVERSGSIVPAMAVMEDPGILVELLQKVVRVGALESIRVGARRTVLIAKQIFSTLRSLILREVSAKNLAGPIGITHLLTKVAETNDISKLLYWLALISVNLGLFNLLPFPILDGGHLLFLAIEKVKGSPVSARIQEWAMNIAFLAIICLAVFVTFNDLKRLFR